MKRFVEDMDTLVSETIAMSKMTAGMIERSVRSLMTGDVSLVEDIIDDFDRIDRYDSEIEVMAIRILTLYQPTAVDIRTVATVMKCITYLERMAKYSKNIAKATEYLADKPSFEPKKLIGPMGDTAVSMVKLVTQGFEKRSVDGFDRIVDMDNYLDDTMHENLDEIIRFIGENPVSADVCSYYISIIKFLERVGDHACKMAEKVTFMVTGMRTTIS